jgi:hypothetical protein
MRAKRSNPLWKAIVNPNVWSLAIGVYVGWTTGSIGWFFGATIAARLGLGVIGELIDV